MSSTVEPGVHHVRRPPEDERLFGSASGNSSPLFDVRSVEGMECFRYVNARRPFGEIALGAQGLQLLGKGDIDQMTERDTLGLGDFSRLDEKRRLQLECEIDLSHCSLSIGSAPPADDSTPMLNCCFANAVRDGCRRVSSCYK
jgi:hypothetical protein